tara:strand:+ start:1297 stop:2064 length:768 start_codon:yes stop_codon:yes gene_type:complete
MSYDLYITGAGVSAKSGIPTFRGEDGYWTIGSSNYTPQEMATRTMYLNQPDEFLLWYFKRFAKYRHVKPNSVHKWLSNKRLITQNIDGLDRKAGNKSFIPIHGSIDKVTLFENQDNLPSLEDAPWQGIQDSINTDADKENLKKILLDAFKISAKTLSPELGSSLKPFVLLFDEYYTELYKISKAEEMFKEATSFIFIGTSFSVNITNIALKTAVSRGCSITIVDPKPVNLKIPGVKYLEMTAETFIKSSQHDKYS